jgi:DMSO reductase anchor subunit
MSFSQTLVHGMSFAQALNTLLLLVLVVGTVMMFRPLLKGIARAFVLVIRQRITARGELAERRAIHAQRMVTARG